MHPFDKRDHSRLKILSETGDESTATFHMIYRNLSHKIESTRAKSNEIMNVHHSTLFSRRYVDLYCECETLAYRILDTPAGSRRFTGGTGQFLLAFPPGIEALDLDAKLAFLEGKKTNLENLLEKLQAEHVSVAVLDTLHAAGASESSVLHAPPHNAAQASAALNAAAAQWPAAASFVSSGKAHPPVPDDFSFYYLATERGKTRSNLPEHTDRTFFWNCAFEEIVHSGKTLAAAALCSLFSDRCTYESRPQTKGHEHWLARQPAMLVKLWSAAKVQDTSRTGAITVLKSYWRAHSDRVLEALQQWFRKIPLGSPAGAAADALGDA